MSEDTSTKMKITTSMPDPMRLLAWALAGLVAVGGYIWRGQVEHIEKLEATIQKEHEDLSQLRTQVLVQGNSSQAMSQGFGELRDEMKELRKALRPLLEEHQDERRGRRREQ